MRTISRSLFKKRWWLLTILSVSAHFLQRPLTWFGPMLLGLAIIQNLLQDQVFGTPILITKPNTWGIPAAKALMDYLWNHGGHRITLTRDADPDRSGRATNAFHMVVCNSLYDLWEQHSIRSLFATGLWPPFEVPDEEVNQLARDMASIEVGKGAKVKITIPLLQLTLADQKRVELEPGVTLHKWTLEDKAVYLHRNSRVYALGDSHVPI